MNLSLSPWIYNIINYHIMYIYLFLFDVISLFDSERRNLDGDISIFRYYALSLFTCFSA